jgi:transposase-like protein
MAGKGEDENPVVTLYERAGGMAEVRRITGIREATLYDWRRKRAIRMLGPALDLARAVEKDPAKVLRLLASVRPK